MKRPAASVDAGDGRARHGNGHSEARTGVQRIQTEQALRARMPQNFRRQETQQAERAASRKAKPPVAPGWLACRSRLRAQRRRRNQGPRRKAGRAHDGTGAKVEARAKRQKRGRAKRRPASGLAQRRWKVHNRSTKANLSRAPFPDFQRDA